MHEVILNVGIDIDTSATQLIFSRLTIENRASSYTVPRTNIVNKEVICHGKIYFTPLRSATEIDVETVKRIVREEYQTADMTPEILRTGAVVTVGETTRKKNTSEVLEALSDLAGDFVVATTGPDLESVLSARGAGTDAPSREKRTAIANVDIGGGTSSIAVYEKGMLRETCCPDIGGRLIRVENGRISYIFPRVQALAATNGISPAVGDRAYPEQLYGVCRLMAVQLAQALRLAGVDSHHAGPYTNNGKPLSEQPAVRVVTYSGGMAGCIYQEMGGDVFHFGNIGVLLEKAIRADLDLNRVEHSTSIETIQATVVEVGIHTTEVNGGTIHYKQDTLPLRNVPIFEVSEENEASLEALKVSILNQMPLHVPEGKAEQLAITFTGEKRTSFTDIQALTAAIIESTKEVISSEYPLVMVMKNDVEKVLGNALNVLLKREKDVICIDGIHTLDGDCIDIGGPITGEQVLSVAAKTLIFNS